MHINELGVERGLCCLLMHMRKHYVDRKHWWVMTTLSPAAFFLRDAFKLPATIPILRTVFLFLNLIFHFLFLFFCLSGHVHQATHKKKGTRRYRQIQESLER